MQPICQRAHVRACVRACMCPTVDVPERAGVRGGTEAVGRIARQGVPGRAGAALPHGGTGLRPHPADAMAVIDRLPSWDNAYLAAGHFTKGVLLSPVTGRLLSEWLVTDRPSAAPEMLSSTRSSGAYAS